MATHKHIPIDKLAGTSTEFEVDGETYKFAPVGPREMAQAKSVLRGHRLAAYEEMVRSMDEEYRPDPTEQRQRRNEIHRMFISDPEVARWWLNDLEGVSWLIHKSINKGRDDEEEPIPREVVDEWLRDGEQLLEMGEKILTELSGYELKDEEESDESGEAQGGE